LSRKGKTYEEMYGVEKAKELRKKLSVAQKKSYREDPNRINDRPSGKDHPMYGKHHSSETRKEISVGIKKFYKENTDYRNSGMFKKGQVPWNKGKKVPREQIETQRASLKRWYIDNPEEVESLHKKQNNGKIDFYQNLRDEGTYNEYMDKKNKKSSESMNGIKFTPDHKRALSDAHWSKKPGAYEIERRIGVANEGHVAWNKGLTKETDERLANSIASQPHSEEWNNKVSVSLQNSEIRQEYYKSPEFLKGCSNGAIAARKAKKIYPNGPETKFIKLCEEYNLPYKYVGNGDFWIKNRNPDFLNINGEKKVVEIDGVYWHLKRLQKDNPSLTREDVEIREMDHYKQYGFESIIIWEDELDNESLVLKKLGVTYD